MLQSGVLLPVLYLLSPFSPLIGAALLLSLMIVILYYLFAKFLSSSQLEAFAREEFSQVIFSILILAAFAGLSIIISTVASAAICGGAGCDHIDLALYSLEVVRGRLVSTYISLYAHEFVIGVLSTVGFYIPVLPINSPVFLGWSSISPFSGLEPVSNALITLIESMGYLYGLAYGRVMLVYFFKDITPVMMAIGFFMRAFPFSRKTGSSLIAIAFAGYFVYPMSILLSHYMIADGLDNIGAVEPPTAPLLCEPPGGSAANPDYVAQQNDQLNEEWAAGISQIDQSGQSSVIAGITSFFTTFFSSMLTRYNFDLLSPNMSPFIHYAYFFVLNQVLSYVQLAVMVLVSFVFEIIVTVTAFRSASQALGGEIEILGLTRVV